ncbi:MAG: AMP-binding protein, partial [Kiloniellales bacterium]
MLEPRSEQTLGQVLRRRAERCPDKAWIVTDERRFTYAEMDRLSNRLARGLAGLGIGAGETVLVMLPNAVEIVLSWCALAKLGAVEVPVNTHLRGGVLAHVINDSAADTLLVDPRYFDRLEAVCSELVALRRLVVVGEPGASADLPPVLERRFEALSFHDLYDQDDAAPAGGPRYCDLMAVMYTSGTTGPSKGVMITHAHAYEYALSVVELLEMTGDDVY